MKDENKCCGTCKYYEPDIDFPDDFICCNDNSVHAADWINEDDVCEEYEAHD